MRGWPLVALSALVACGRFGFDLERSATDPDANANTDADDDAPDAAPPGWTAIVAGDQTTCGIYEDRAYCWGRGSRWQIGDGMDLDRALPTAVALPPGKVTQLAQGEDIGCAIVDERAYCWGQAPPGNGGMQSITPVAVGGLPSPVTAVGCGDRHACVIAAGDVYCWGYDINSSLGNGPQMTIMPTAAVLDLPAAATSLSTGNDHSLALLADGTVWGWGHNDNGALGLGSTPGEAQVPMQTMLANVQPIIGGWHACAIIGGAAQCWGTGLHGMLGNGSTSNRTTPVTVSGLDSGVELIDTNGGPDDYDATCALQAGTLWCWGAGVGYRLGTGSTDDESTPVAVAQIPSNVAEIAVGFLHTCVRTTDGAVLCWGAGDLGQLGDGNQTTSPTPVEVPLPAP